MKSKDYGTSDNPMTREEAEALPPVEAQKQAAEPAPWEALYDGVSRLKVPGGYVYDIKGKGLCFTPGA